MALIKIFLNASDFTKINLILFLIFVSLLVFNSFKALENRSQRIHIEKKIDKIKDVIHNHTREIVNRLVSDESISDANISEENTVIENKIKKLNVKAKTFFSKFNEKKIIIYKLSLNLQDFKGSQDFAFIGVTKLIKKTYSPLKRWVFHESLLDCVEKNEGKECNYAMFWYCISSEERYLPDQLKYISRNNINAKWVPFKCRW